MVNNNERSSSSQDYPEVVFLTSCGQGSKRIIIKDIAYIEATGQRDKYRSDPLFEVNID